MNRYDRPPRPGEANAVEPADLSAMGRRLHSLSEDLAHWIERHGVPGAGPPVGWFDVDAVGAARRIRQVIRQRRLRSRFFPPDLFADPAWDILLDLTAARLEGAPVPISSLCLAAGVPTTTALRWITSLVEMGLLIRRPDPTDRRRVFIEMTEAAWDGMASFFRAAGAPHLLS